MTSRLCTYAMLILSLSCVSLAQVPNPPAPPRVPQGMTMCGLPAPAPSPFGGLGRRGLAQGGWWKQADIVQKLKLSDAQIKQMEQVIQDHRLKLVDLHAALQREEVRLQPMVQADNPNESQVLAQIDKVAAQRANLEKANAQMAFDVRRILTPEQWKTLQTLRAERPMGFRSGMRGMQNGRRGNRQGMRGNRQGMGRMQQGLPPVAPVQPAPAPQQ